MTTQYTTILKLALPVQGELSGTWGDVVNNNITQMVEQAIAGKATVNSWTANSHTLTTADGTTSESRCAILELTDSGTALTGAGTVVCPTNTKLYIVDNNTAQIVTVKTSGGTGIAVPVGKTMLVYCDGTNVVEGVTHANSLSLGTSTVTADKILDEDNMASDSATAIATQQSIKAYVDSQVGSFDTLAEVLAQGNTTGGTDIAVGTGDDITFADNSKAIFGANSDLQIFSNGTSSYIIEGGSGNLEIRATDIFFKSADNTKALATFDADGAASISHNGSTKLATTATGIDVTGTATMDGLTVSASAATANITSTSGGATLKLTHPTAIDGYSIRQGNANADDFRIFEGSKIKLNITTGGDISFYEDTGTTPKLVWDASAESLGIGTSSPNRLLELYGTSNPALRINNGTDFSDIAIASSAGAIANSSLNGALVIARGGANAINLATNGIVRATVDSAGNVGIGTISPTGLLHLAADNAHVISKIMASTTGYDAELWLGRNDTRKAIIRAEQLSANSDHDLVFFTNGASADATEKVRITSAGDVAIGTSSPAAKLHIENGDMRIEKDTKATIGFRGHTAGSTALAFRDASAAIDRMTIDASGNLLVGVTSTTLTGGSLTLPNSGIIAFHDAGGAARNVLQFVSGNIKHGAAGSGVTTQSFYTSNTLAATIDSSGNVGIGTATTTAIRLTATTATANHIGLQVENSNTADSFGMVVKAGNDANDYTADFRKRDNTTIMRIRGDGNVGIGTSSPAYKLSIGGAFQSVNTDLISITDTATIYRGTPDGTGFEHAKILSGRDASTFTYGSFLSFYTEGKNSGTTDASTEAMRIDASGNVGIGETLPLGKLHVKSADSGASANVNGNTLVVENSGTTGLSILSGTTGDGNIFFSDLDNNLAGKISYSHNGDYITILSSGASLFYNAGAEAMRISAAGQLFLNVTTEVSAGYIASIKCAAGTGGVIIQNSGSNNVPLSFRSTTAATVGTVTTTESATSYNTSSDQRLKENIADADDAGSKIDAIQVRKFDWKADGSHQDYGMVAQELLEVAPEAVSASEDPEEMMGVDYSKLVPMLIKEVQSLRARVAQLES